MPEGRRELPKMWSGSGPKPWERHPCLNEECDRDAVGTAWFCCGFCADASDHHQRAGRHGASCDVRNPDRVPVRAKGDGA